jgi:hypothetical protein
MFGALEYFLRNPDPTYAPAAVSTYDQAAYAGSPVAGQGVSLMYPSADTQWAAPANLPRS